MARPQYLTHAEVSHGGCMRSIREWGARLGVEQSEMLERLEGGMPVDMALTLPCRGGEDGSSLGVIARIEPEAARARWAALLGIPLELYY